MYPFCLVCIKISTSKYPIRENEKHTLEHTKKIMNRKNNDKGPILKSTYKQLVKCIITMAKKNRVKDDISDVKTTLTTELENAARNMCGHLSENQTILRTFSEIIRLFVASWWSEGQRLRIDKTL